VQNQHNQSTLMPGSLPLYALTIGTWAVKLECICSDWQHQLDVQHGLTQNQKYWSLIVYFTPGKSASITSGEKTDSKV